ncbi:MAG TPA: hypothetical protein VEB64_14620 [Azospirillaceae bacterium]|nr:hypothetical protein [Azospirillaceae bacterium]
MSAPMIIEEKGSFRLVEQGGRYAVIEMRNGQVYDVHPADVERSGKPDTPAGIESVAQWTDEREARNLFAELTVRGDDLARGIW